MSGENRVCENGVWFHKDPCASGRTWFNRLAAREGFSKDIKEYRKANQNCYDYQLFDMLNSTASHRGDNNRRNKMMRSIALKFMQECRSYSKTFEQRPTLLLGEEAFVAFCKRELGLSDEKSKQKWLDDSTSRSTLKRTEDGILKVGIRGHTVLVAETGRESSASAQQEGHGDGRDVAAHLQRTVSLAKLSHGDESLEHAALSRTAADKAAASKSRSRSRGGRRFSRARRDRSRSDSRRGRSRRRRGDSRSLVGRKRRRSDSRSGETSRRSTPCRSVQAPSSLGNSTGGTPPQWIRKPLELPANTFVSGRSPSKHVVFNESVDGGGASSGGLNAAKPKAKAATGQAKPVSSFQSFFQVNEPAMKALTQGITGVKERLASVDKLLRELESAPAEIVDFIADMGIKEGVEEARATVRSSNETLVNAKAAKATAHTEAHETHF